MALLEIEGVSKRLGGAQVLDGISLGIEAGEFFTLLGPSGSGKTTLLRLIAGFETPDAGRIVLDGRDTVALPAERRPVHTVFQSYALFPHLSVAENVAFSLRLRKLPRSEIATRVRDAIASAHLAGLEGRLPQQLSGGQKQRVAIARALIDRPRVLLLDEPLAAMDLKLREQMRVELIGLQRELGITFIFVTHDQGEALALSHRVAVMDQGRIVQVGPPAEVYEFPRTRFVADFIGTTNLYPARVRDVREGRMTLELEELGTVIAHHRGTVRAGETGALSLRPEKIRIEAAFNQHAGENRLRGRVRDHLYLGDVTVYHVEVGRAVVEALLPNSAASGARFFEVGDEVSVAWKVDAGRFLSD